MPEGCEGSSKSYTEYPTLPLKIYGIPNRNIMRQPEILSDVEKEIFYLQHHRWSLKKQIPKPTKQEKKNPTSRNKKIQLYVSILLFRHMIRAK